MRNVVIVSAAALALVAGAAQAQELKPGARTHDGFFLQMDLGLGGLNSSAEQGGIEAEISGGAGQFSIGLGGALTPNFILAGQLWGVSAIEPTFKVNGTSFSGHDTTFTLSGIGLQLVYYFMPINLYLSATPSITRLSFEEGGNSGETETGFGMKFAIGKEWWVADNWALGLNGQFAFSSNKDKGDNAPSWGTTWFGVAFSATYN